MFNVIRNALLVLEKNIIDLCEAGQVANCVDGKWVDDYKPYVRGFAGRIKDEMKIKNPLDLVITVRYIDKVLEIINPELLKEIEWFKNIRKALVLYTNDRIKTNRILGIKNDNLDVE